MKLLCRAAHVLVAALFALALPASATSFGTDQSDLYYIPTESGWGVQLVQRGPVIFATMFVYDPASAPTWYVATMNFVFGSTWSGDLYATTGPWFGTVPFNPANVVATKVGTMSWVSRSDTTGTLSYEVNGVPVAKQVVRQTLVFDDFSGTYTGALHLSVTGCTDPAADVTVEGAATISLIQYGSSVTLSIVNTGVTITVSGTLTQSGQFGGLAGTYTSSVGELGNAALSAMNVQANALSSSIQLDSANNGCRDVGYFAGMRNRP